MHSNTVGGGGGSQNLGREPSAINRKSSRMASHSRLKADGDLGASN